MRLSACAIQLVVVGLQISAGQGNEHSRNEAGSLLQLTPLRPAQGRSVHLFERMPASQTGLDLEHRFPAGVAFEYLQDHGCATGVCIADYDNNGDADIFITNYDKGSRLYRNLGGWRFEDATQKAGVAAVGRWCSGATFGDIDNDGYLDLFVAVFNGPNLLYLNQRDGTFKEAATAAGLDFSGASVQMAFADYDGDGRLDGYLVTNRKFIGTDHRLPRNSTEGFRRSILQTGASGKPQINPRYAELFDLIDKGIGHMELTIAGQPDRLYRNQGNGTFALMNEAAGIRGNEIGLAATWWDYNDDGRPDLYVSNDYKGTDRLYHNDGNGSFTEVTRQALPHIAWASMGADIADLNNDGRMDLMTTDMAGSSHERHMLGNGDLDDERWFLMLANPPQYRRNAVYLNTGTSNLLEIACLAGLAATDWTWSPKFADFDNDGWIDLFVSNGMSRDFMNSDLLREFKGRGHTAWRSASVLREANFAFKNTGDLGFQNVGSDWGLNMVSASFGVAVADLDRDGDMDLVVTSFDEPVAVYRNNSTSGNRMLIRLKGVASNSWGVSAKVKAETVTGIQTRSVTLGSGFMSANEPLVHFGLGDEKLIRHLEIDWPSGRRQALTNLPAGFLYSITEPTNATQPASKSVTQPALFEAILGGSAIRHREEPFDDHAWQPLLPWKHSRWGPGIALGDINNDGSDDLFLGGGSGHAGILSFGTNDGRFRPASFPALESDKESEDLGAVFLDADGDDDFDLFVVSGGSEANPEDVSPHARLYYNDGRGNFTKAPLGAVPDLREAQSVLAAADFDRDGDLDLFIGGHSMPAGNPRPAKSRLLRNRNGRFEDVSEAAGLSSAPIAFATGALWSDVNDDGWVDLLVTQHWGPIKLLINERGVLIPVAESGLEQYSGFWNGIAGADLNGDGFVDYVVTNWGLNNPRRLAPATPTVAYVGDLSGSGRHEFVQAFYRGKALLPVASRDEMIGSFPDLAEKFPSYVSYASASISNLFTPEALGKATRYEVNTLESGILLNDGAGHFTFHSLPRLAQVAPAFGVAIADFDGDGQRDVVLGQNFSHNHPEAGRLRGGLSILLLGEGQARFNPVWPEKSGIAIPEDARSVVACNLNSDQWPDLLVGINDGEMVAFKNRGSNKNRVLALRLKGLRLNRAAIGARVTVELSDNSAQTAEIYAGSGFLSQSSGMLTFGLGTTNTARRIKVRWPDGQITSKSLEPNEIAVLLHAPQ